MIECTTSWQIAITGILCSVWAYKWVPEVNNKWKWFDFTKCWDESKGKMRPRKRKKSGHRLNSDMTCSSEPHMQLYNQRCFSIINEQDEKTSDRKEKWDWEGRYEALHIRLLTASEACRYVCNCCSEAFMRSAKENIWASIHMLNTCFIRYAIFVSVLLVRHWFM